MILPHCLGFKLPEMSENNQTMWNKKSNHVFFYSGFLHVIFYREFLSLNFCRFLSKFLQNSLFEILTVQIGLYLFLSFIILIDYLYIFKRCFVAFTSFVNTSREADLRTDRAKRVRIANELSR